MITFSYLGRRGVYNSLTRIVEWRGETFEYANICHEMRIQIENASC